MISAFSRLVKSSTVILPDMDVNSRGVFYSSLTLPFVIGTIALQRICDAFTLGLWRLQHGIFNSPMKRRKYLNSFYANIPLIITVWVVSSNLLLANAGNMLESTFQKNRWHSVPPVAFQSCIIWDGKKSCTSWDSTIAPIGFQSVLFVLGTEVLTNGSLIGMAFRQTMSRECSALFHRQRQ